MGVAVLLRRRLSTHPVALVAVATSVLMSMVVVATLQLLSSAIADASVRTALDVPGGSRSVALAAGVRPGELADVDRRVRAALAQAGPGAVVTRTAAATSRGIRGRAGTDRARLAEVADLPNRARLVSGTWPAPPGDDVGPGTGVLDVVLPTTAATALGVEVGQRLSLTDLVQPTAKPLSVVVTGTYDPVGADRGLWADDPLGLAGVSRSDYTTYGPFLVAAGTFDRPLAGPSTVTWRWLPATTSTASVTTHDLPALRGEVDGVLDALRRTAGILASGTPDPRGAVGGDPLRDARISSGLPDLLDTAALVSSRVRVSLLTPTVLLVVLGTASLVVAAALLASLRESETRLMRTRGASARQLGVLALADAGLAVLLGAAGAVVLAPVLASAVARSAGLDLGGGGGGDAAPVLAWTSLWWAVGLMALLAVVVIVGTTLRVGRARDGLGGRRAGRVVQLLTGSGLDVLLVGLGALAVVQLRRYDAAGSTTVDPLTTAAPAVVIAGLAVLCLRLLPVIARQIARLTGGARRIEPAWGGWQLARRLSGQAGTVLLVLLAVAMGTLALSHSSTASRAVLDQSAFETGAPLRVVVGPGAGLAGTTGPLLARAAGGRDRVVPVARGAVDVGALRGVTTLAIDARTAASVAEPRADTLDGSTWSQLLARLTAARREAEGVPLPGEPTRITVRAHLDSRVGALPGDGTAPVSVVLRDARGLVTALPAGTLGESPTDLSVALPSGDLRMDYPLTLLGVSARAPIEVVDPDAAAPALALTVEAVTADGAPVPGLGVLQDRSRAADLLVAGAAADVESIPALVTRPVADAARARVGSGLTLTISGRRLPVTVVGVVDSVPTAGTPDRAVVVDLPTVLAAGDVPTTDRRPSATVVEPGEWWVDPRSRSAVTDAVRTGMPAGTTVIVRSDLVAQRSANPVNAGMRAAMLLVTAAALVLAAVGFAATTAALGRTRRAENAVLLALGMAPGRIRRVLALERVGVVALTVAVGLLLGLLSSLAVVPVLVGGDGHVQVPGVVVSLPVGELLAFGVVVAAVLSAVGVLVLRSSGRDVAAELRGGERP